MLALQLLCALAAALLARAVDGTPPPTGNDPPTGGNPRPPSPIPEDMAATSDVVNSEQWVPLPECWELGEVFQSTLLPPETRYFARRWTSPTTSWICPNSFTRGVPLTPPPSGPRPCGCLDLFGRATTVYGQHENARLWPWMADWYDPAHPERPYAANIWNGMGPCPRMGHTSVLHRFPSTITDSGDPSWFWIGNEARREMEAQEALDESLAPLLLDQGRREALPRIRRRVYEGAQQLPILRARWAAWVYSLLERRARLIYELIGRRTFRALQNGFATRIAQLRDRRYFGSGPQGAWFNDPIAQADVIRRFIMEGIPVYYRWEVEYDALPFLADLAPPAGPAPNSPRRLPPPTPSRGRQPSARHPARHYDSVRHPPVWATERDGTPYLADDVDLHMLTPLDPDARAPERPSGLSERSRSSSRSRSRSSSGSSMRTDDVTVSSVTNSDFTPQRPRTPRPRTPPLALRLSTEASIELARNGFRVVGDRIVTERTRARTPESPVELARRRVAANSRPLSERINMDAPPNNIEARLAAPSIYEFLQEGDGGRDVGPFVPAPRRDVAYWALHIMEHERSPAYQRLRDLIARGEIEGEAQMLEYVERRGFAFMTAGLFPSRLAEEERGALRIPPGDIDAHAVPHDFRISANTPEGQVLYAWARGVRLVLSRPHARAALMHGGLLWRIARWAGLTPERARAGPSREAREEGSSRYLVQGVSDGPVVLTDDWLSQEEIDTLLGVELHSSRALWPDPELIRHNWWQGEWTDEHEGWFLERLTTLMAVRGIGIARTHGQWRAHIRNRDYLAHGGRRNGRNNGNGDGN